MPDSPHPLLSEAAKLDAEDPRALLEEATREYSGPDCPTCGGELHGKHRPVKGEDGQWRRCSAGDVVALASALRAALDERQRAMRTAYDLTLDTQTIGEAVTELVRLVRQARTERDTAQAEVEAMREVVDAAEQLASCDLSFFNNSLVHYASKLRDALRALDARGKGRTR